MCEQCELLEAEAIAREAEANGLRQTLHYKDDDIKSLEVEVAKLKRQMGEARGLLARIRFYASHTKLAMDVEKWLKDQN